MLIYYLSWGRLLNENFICPTQKGAALGELWAVCLFQKTLSSKTYTWFQEVKQITELDNVFMWRSFNTLDTNW